MIPWNSAPPDPAIMSRQLGPLGSDLSLVLAFQSWLYEWERCPSPDPSLTRIRLVHHRRSRDQMFLLDLLVWRTVRSRWSAIRDTVRQTQMAATARGEPYFLMTECAVPPVLRTNLERLRAFRGKCPTREVERAICLECPPGVPISLGILIARSARLGIDAPTAEAAIMWLLSGGSLTGNLRRPLGRGFLLRRLWDYGPASAIPSSPEQNRRVRPPWHLSS